MLADLDEVMAIEQIACSFPWSRANFEDALQSGYLGICMRDANHELIGYCLLMPVLDEMHLLNLCVAPIRQGQGMGFALLTKALHIMQAAQQTSMLLEVRQSNQGAIKFYKRLGFNVIGYRKNYYPAYDGAREDALVMRFILSESHRPS